MKANQLSKDRFRKDDEAVSPVIAVILMVAITVVLAATVYVWVSGFGQSGEQAPAASFKITNCDTSTNDLKVKLLSSSKSLAHDDLRFEVTNDNGGSEGTGWTESGSDPWTVGSTLTLAEDSGTALNASTTYTLDIVHTPSGNIIGSPQYTC